MNCEVCGIVDEHYDENSIVFHNSTPKHICNMILYRYQQDKKQFMGNRDGIVIVCTAESIPLDPKEKPMRILNSDSAKIRMFAKPSQKVRYNFNISNSMKDEHMLIVGVQLAHPQPQFELFDNGYVFGGEPHILKKKTSVNEVYVRFDSADIGQYEMPIMFTFRKPSISKDLIIIREMIVMVQEEFPVNDKYTKSPYTNKDWAREGQIIHSLNHLPFQNVFKVPKLLKILFPRGLEERALEGLDMPNDVLEQLRLLLINTRALFDEGITKENYVTYFRHLLWWEEVIAGINLRRYNMTGVTLEQRENRMYALFVPGLAENRPSLLRGDRIFLRPVENMEVTFESVVKDIEDEKVLLHDIDQRFHDTFRPEAKYNVRFIMSRVPIERMQEALSRVAVKHVSRLFPQAVKTLIHLKPIDRYYNSSVARNAEQRSAVHHILSGTSGAAPYMVFGPPGTGKTVTVVEAILQIVASNPKHRVLVCTDSNMAADHIALMLLQYNKALNMSNFLIRANSQSRVWSVLPSQLGPVSNGTSYETFFSVSNVHISQYRIVVTTLLHAAKYASDLNQGKHKLVMSHLVIDEAAQASEPATLVPVTGLLAPRGRLVLAGDPQQLGPVCISRAAKDRGLGLSLMERLRKMYPNLYDNNDPNYITMLVKNFRSHPDVLRLPNELFYENNLKALAPFDPLSDVCILGGSPAEGAIVFHSVMSKEQRMGKAPSFFNEKELDMLKRYILALINVHGVTPKDIGIIAPYIRQVYKMKTWLNERRYNDIEVGTVESFQGKEKRVILVSTVRANSALLDYDAKYGLGFLVDDKRFNVTITRAKAKLIIIGNAACLTRDCKWRMYMELCRQTNSYYGQECEQLERTADILTEVAKTKFDKCHLSEYLKPKPTDDNNNKKKGKGKKKVCDAAN